MNIDAVNAITTATELVAEHAADDGIELMICIDWAESKVEFFGQHESTNATTGAEWHGHETNLRLPKVDARDIKAALLQLAPRLQELAKCYTSEWNGSNHVATWTDRDDRDDFQSELENAIDDMVHSGRVTCAADEWFSTVDTDDLKITLATTDKELEEQAGEHEGEALHEGFVLYGAERYLISLRDEVLEELAE